MNKLLKEHFENFYKNDRMSHAFLICNTTLNNLKEDLSIILSDYFFDSEVNLEENSDIFIIRPEKDRILKESILELQEVFKTKSQYNKNRVYIIDEAHKMNDSASNSLLKFLEEPEEDIYAFLVSSNVDKVLPTIKSRCQVVFVNNQSSFNLADYDEELIKKAINFVTTFENHGVNSIAYIYQVVDKKEDKENLKILIKLVKYFYRDALNNLLGQNVIYYVDDMDAIKYVNDRNTIKSLVRKLIILNKNENMLEYNLNSNLFLDNLIIEMDGEKNE